MTGEYYDPTPFISENPRHINSDVLKKLGIISQEEYEILKGKEKERKEQSDRATYERLKKQFE